MFVDIARKILAEYPDREAFFAVVGRFYPEDDVRYKLIVDAYETAEKAFEGVYRDSGEKYFEHLRAVALIIMLHLRQHSHVLIIAALLHDIIEDIKGWNYERLRSKYGDEVAMLVWWVSKPHAASDAEKNARNRDYHHRFNNAPRGALIIKLADRFHNMLTLWETTPEKRKRKIIETQDFYLPLAEKEMLLIHELEAVLHELQTV